MAELASDEALLAFAHVNIAYHHVLQRWNATLRRDGNTAEANVELANDMITLAVKLTELGEKLGIEESSNIGKAMKDLYI